MHQQSSLAPSLAAQRRSAALVMLLLFIISHSPVLPGVMALAAVWDGNHATEVAVSQGH